MYDRFAHDFLNCCILPPLPEFARLEVFQIAFFFVAFPLEGDVEVCLPMWLTFQAVAYVIKKIQYIEKQYESLRLLPEVNPLVVYEHLVLVGAYVRSLVLEDYERPQRNPGVVP